MGAGQAGGGVRPLPRKLFVASSPAASVLHSTLATAACGFVPWCGAQLAVFPLPWRCSGLHFLAVMPDEESEVCSGLWLLLDRKPPNV